MSDRLRVVLVGTGNVANAWMNSSTRQNEVEIVGLVDLREEAAQKMAERYELNDVVIGSDVDAVLAQTKPEAVFNCTVPVAHHAVTMAALAHGCHVLCEKPLADNMTQAREMVAAADQANRLFAVIQNRRYSDHIRRAQAFLASGVIGTPHSIHADFFIGADFGGFRAKMDHVLLLDMAIHSFDQARMLVPAAPRSCTCVEWNPPASAYAHGASAVATFTMDAGQVFSYRGSWTSVGLNTTWECDWRVIGDLGSFRWNGGDDFKAEVWTDPKQASAENGGGLIRSAEAVEIPVLDQSLSKLAHDGVIGEFVACVRSGNKPETIGSDNIHSFAMVEMAIASAEANGAPVSLDQL